MPSEQSAKIVENELADAKAPLNDKVSEYDLMNEDEKRKLSDSLKEEANELLNNGRYLSAISKYNEAISIFPTAILYSNRAMAHLKLENYGLAIQDSESAMAMDPQYLKAYYRRASALLALGKHKEARKDFVSVANACPKDKNAAKKVVECDKAIKRVAFEKALAVSSVVNIEEEYDPTQLIVPDDYKGPVLPEQPAPTNPSPTSIECSENPSLVNANGISLDFVRELAAYQKGQKNLSKKFVWDLLLRFRALNMRTKSLVHVDFPDNAHYYNVCGDTHGQYYDTLNIFESLGEPSPTNPYVFNGDYVDRGSFSVENVLLLVAWKLMYPEYFHLTRGNHETKDMNTMYGFEGEVVAKYCRKTMKLFTEVFQTIPLAVCVEKKVLILHGGLFERDGVTLADIEKSNRFQEPPNDGIMRDILWSDPQANEGRDPSKRGVGKTFGPDVTKAFLESNNLELLIRSHEVREEGYTIDHDGKCITVFSAPNYCDHMGNKGAVCRLVRDRIAKPEFFQFEAVPHPPVRPMAYASGFSAFGL